MFIRLLDTIGRAGLLVSAVAALLFLPAGRLDWTEGWVTIAMLFASLGAVGIWLRIAAPDLAEERRTARARAKPWDRMLANELDGYADFARDVRYRLLPGVW